MRSDPCNQSSTLRLTGLGKPLIFNLHLNFNDSEKCQFIFIYSPPDSSIDAPSPAIRAVAAAAQSIMGIQPQYLLPKAAPCCSTAARRAASICSSKLPFSVLPSARTK